MISALLIVRRDGWRRFWLGVEDPRAIGLFRIVFGLLVICNINGLWEHFVFLFTDEGLFPAEVARQVFASHQFAGFGDGAMAGEPWGFFDAEALGRFLSGPRYSLLYLWDSPTALWIHLVAFWLVALAFVVGAWTRVTGILTFLLMNSLMHRNLLFWEGTDVVVRVFLAYLVLARSGHAYSVDNWWRCRRLRRAGRLSEPGGPGEGAGVAPCDAHPEGLEAVYRRIPVWPRRLMMLQLATVYFTTGALKSGSVWASGDAIYYALNLDHFYRIPPQALSAALGTNVMRLATWVVRFGEIGFALVFVGAVLRANARPPSEAPSRTARLRAWLVRWPLSRRVWITWAVLVMGGILVAMNIGQFQTVMLSLCLVYFRGEELAGALARLRRSPAAIPVEDEDLPHLQRADRALPGWALWITLVAGLTAGWVQAVGGPSAWIALGMLGFLAGVTWARLRRDRAGQATRAWAYGPWGRLLVSAGLLWHIGAVAVWLLPNVESIRSVRTPARAVVRPWLRTTQTDQGWSMFAPNPPRANVLLQVLVTDAHGEIWDLRTDVYAPEQRPIPFIWNDRIRKMNRRLIGGERNNATWYRKWYARYHCRQWAMEHDGVGPRSVQLVRRSYRIPSPEQTRAQGWYEPMELLERQGTSKVVHTEQCATAVLGQPSPQIRQRHGLPEGEHRPWVKRRRAQWETRAR
ncbi:MAG: hypothetical protein AAGF11_28885 [Myxococcota bacterium]